MGPLSNHPAPDPVPATPMWQLDGADNGGFQLEQGAAAAVDEPQASPVPVHGGELEVLQQVSCYNYVLRVMLQK